MLVVTVAGISTVVRRGALAGGLAFLAVACLAPEARARDVVRLRNGRSLEGKVARETGEYVVLEVEGGVLRLARSDIFTIERDEPLADWEAEMRVQARREAEELAKKALAELEAAGAAGEGGPEAGKASKELVRRLKELVEDMADEDPDTRRAARQLMEREGRKAVPVLTGALSHRNAFARTAAAEMLGRLGARQSVRDMIVALRSSVPDAAKIRPWQRTFVKALRGCLRSVTGRSFGLNPRGAAQSGAVAKWVEWWDGKPDPKEPGGVPRGAYADWDTPQLGEPELDEEDPEYAKKLWEARRLGNKRYSYSRPANYGAGTGEEE